MIRRPPRSTRTDTLCPYTTLFRSRLRELGFAGWEGAARDLLVQCRVVRKTNSTSFWRDTVAVEAWAGLEEKIADLVDYTCATRSEEHTSELQSLMRISYAVFCLKKKKNRPYKQTLSCR